MAIFFLISGFLLYRPFLVARRGDAPSRVSAYARRRVLRIVPAYWAALTIFIAAGFVSGVTAHNWWVFYAFGQVYSSTLIGRGIGVAWTLGVEVTFYALLPVFALGAGRLASRSRSMRADVVLLVILAAASLAFRAHYSSFLDAEKVSTLAGTFSWFALGAPGDRQCRSGGSQPGGSLPRFGGALAGGQLVWRGAPVRPVL